MARWGRAFFHKFKEKIKQHKDVMERLADKVDFVSIQQFLEAKENLNVLFDQEESYWKQRAKLFWLAEGDDNTEFFHSSASARRKSNRIGYLIDENNNRVENEEGKCEIVYDYFVQLFSGESTVCDGNMTKSPRRISREQNDFLTSALVFEEFTEAINQMHPDKASGPDGLNPAFFQTFWSTMGQEIFGYCRDWLRDIRFPNDLNSTNVVLIPKKDNAYIMKDLRPIALCNVL